MKKRKHTHRRQFTKANWRHIIAGGLAAFFVGTVAYLAAQGLRAASYVTNKEVEYGTLAGNANLTTDNNASNRQAVRFGAATPTNLKAITGGDSIALLWDMPNNTVGNIEVYRNGSRIATVIPGSGVIRAEKIGTRYIDRSVTRGTTYQYQVRIVNLNGNATPLSSAVSATHPTNTTPIPTVTIDAGQATDLINYLNNSAKPEIEIWYSKLADSIASPGYTPINNMRLFMDSTYTGVASASYTTRTIRVNPAWLRANLEDGGGMFVHEATHILQAYPSDPTSWVTEGIADWVRDWFTRERYKIYLPQPEKPLTAGYSDSGGMLQWTAIKYNQPNIIRDINIAMHNGTYTSSFMSSRTGKSPEQLFAEMKSHYMSTLGSVSGLGKCMDVANANVNLGAKVQLLGCNNSVAQKWLMRYKGADIQAAKDTTQFHLANTEVAVSDRCLDVVGSGVTNGTLVQSWTCNRSIAQTWTRGSNNSLVNPNSGKCLAASGNSSADGTQLIITTCNGSSNQSWAVPPQ